MGSHLPFDKQISEARTVEFDFADEMNKFSPATTLSSAAVSVVDLSTGDAANSIVSTTSPSPSGTKVSVRAVANQGTSGRNYKITFRVTASNGEVWEEDIVMRLREI